MGGHGRQGAGVLVGRGVSDRIRDALRPWATLQPGRVVYPVIAEDDELASLGIDAAAARKPDGYAYLTDQQAADLQQHWREQYARPGAAHRIAVLPSASFPCSYCRTDPGSGPNCRTCGAPA